LGVHFCIVFQLLSSAALPKWQLLIVRVPSKVCGIAVALSPSGKFAKREQKVMQKGTKLLKRIWKAVVYIELVMVAGALLFASQYFSWDVFMSHVNQQAAAATSTRPR
jgi:magnesium-transporting ATPase (P-type)